MSKPYLTLPCKYKLADFTKGDQGYHCSSCDHQLQDFRGLSTEEINQQLYAADGKTCGIFDSSQLATRTANYPIGIQRQIGLSLLGILGFISPAVLTSCNDNQADLTDKQHEQAFNKLRFPLFQKGTLKDSETGKVIPHATIRLVQEDKTVLTGITDKSGKFSITVNNGDLSKDNFELILQQHDYTNDTLNLSTGKKANTLANLNLTLEAASDCNMPEVDGVAYIPRPGKALAGEPMLPEPPPMMGLSMPPSPEVVPPVNE